MTHKLFLNTYRAFSLFGLATLWCVMPRTVSASSILTDGTWYEFYFTGVGSAAQGCSRATCPPSSGGDALFAPTPAWTFSSSAPLLLTITDAFQQGDSFEVLDNGIAIGATPVVPVTNHNCGSDPVDCVNDPDMSHAQFLLAPGVYSLTIIPETVSVVPGSAYFSVTVAPTPEPDSAGVVLVSGIIFVMLGYRRRRAVAVQEQTPRAAFERKT